MTGGPTIRDLELIKCGAALVPSLELLRPHEVLRLLSSALVQTTGWPEEEWLARHQCVLRRLFGQGVEWSFCVLPNLRMLSLRKTSPRLW